MRAPSEYIESVKQIKSFFLQGKDISEVSERLLSKSDEKVLSVTVDSKIRIYTHYSDFDSGYVVGIYYIFNKKDGKFIGVKVI